MSESKTHKTESVMRLLTRSESNSAKNPILDDKFKQENILAEQIEKEADIKPTVHHLPQTGTGVEINVTSELISEWLPAVLKRFNCCTCSLCRAEASVEALERLTSMKVTVRTEEDMKRADELKESAKRRVLTELIRIAIARRSLPKHV